MSNREDNSWHIGDPVIEWGGRAEGGTDQQFEFSDMKKIVKKTKEKESDSH